MSTRDYKKTLELLFDTLASIHNLCADLTEAQKNELKIKGGVRIESLQDIAAKAGLREGDVILAVGNMEITQMKDFSSAVSKMDKSKPVSILFRRGELTRFALIKPSS